VVRTAKDVDRVRRLSFPVACKLLSPQLIHKKDIGGVVLGIRSPAEVQAALTRFAKLAGRRGIRFDGVLVQEMVSDGVEMILGATRDPTFGPVVALGMGGTYAEVIRDYALAVAPVTPSGARRMLSTTKLGRILGGYRGGPRVSTAKLSRLVSSFSRVLVENPEIDQIEVNPLIAGGNGILAVDTRVAFRQGARSS
jgi:acetyl-CoA synthetase (ADP-forming)